MTRRTLQPSPKTNSPEGRGPGWNSVHNPERGRQRRAELRGAVTRAIEALGTGFIEHPKNDNLRRRLETGKLSTQEFYRQLIRVLFRLLFLFIAEERDLLHPPDATKQAKSLYNATYSTRYLRKLAHHEHAATHPDLWNILSRVSASLAKPEGCPKLALPGLGSFLWDNASTPDILGPAQTDSTNHVRISNAHMLDAIRALDPVEHHNPRTNPNNQTRSPRVLGSIYESLLGQTPDINLEANVFALDTASGNQRKSTGAYYTPDTLIQHLLDSALEPVIQDRLNEAATNARTDRRSTAQAQEHALLSITVCDPAVGSGHFLIAAAHRLARHLARVRTGDAQPSRTDHQHALRDVIRNCLYGVDINPIAAELCKATLWLESKVPGAPLTFLDNHIKVGNALLGTAPTLMDAGIPNDAIKPREADDKNAVVYSKERNKQERNAETPCKQRPPQHTDTETRRSEHARLCANAWCAAFVWPKHHRDAQGALPGPPSECFAMTERIYRDIEESPHNVDPWIKNQIDRLASEYQFFHWHIEFPEIFNDNTPNGAPSRTSTPTQTHEPQHSEHPQHGFDVILGNPPFLNQLESATAASRRTAALLSAITNRSIKAYTDQSAAFLLQASRICRPQGRVALVLPQSLLAAKDARQVRAAVLDNASLTNLWISNEHVFDDATIFTCAPTLHRQGPRASTLTRTATASFTPIPHIEIDNDTLQAEETWAHLAAAALGIPEFHYHAPARVADIAHATADFRDQYYGLKGFLIENHHINQPETQCDEQFPPIITTGLVDLATSHWGTKKTKLLKQTWHAPRIHRDRMRTQGTLADWISARLIPKIILATQTKVLEVLVDETGRYVPSLPLITITPKRNADLWKAAAALASPVCTSLALQKYSGTALSVQAIKLSATQTRNLPLPAESPQWHNAADLLKRAHTTADRRAKQQILLDYAHEITAAYRVPAHQAQHLLTWWTDRLGAAASQPEHAPTHLTQATPSEANAAHAQAPRSTPQRSRASQAPQQHRPQPRPQTPQPQPPTRPAHQAPG